MLTLCKSVSQHLLNPVTQNSLPGITHGLGTRMSVAALPIGPKHNTQKTGSTQMAINDNITEKNTGRVYTTSYEI